MKQAQAVGANAVLNVRFATSSITQGAAELLLGLVLAITGYFAGRLNERRHYASIRRRERETSDGLAVRAQ